MLTVSFNLLRAFDLYSENVYLYVMIGATIVEAVLIILGIINGKDFSKWTLIPNYNNSFERNSNSRVTPVHKVKNQTVD